MGRFSDHLHPDDQSEGSKQSEDRTARFKGKLEGSEDQPKGSVDQPGGSHDQLEGS